MFRGRTNTIEELLKNFSPVARQVFMEFIAKKNEVEKIVDTTALVVLVWGPGEKTDDRSVYDLRCGIKDELIKLGHAAFLSEELEPSPTPTVRSVISELAQAIAADLVLLVLAPWGAQAEVAKYSSDIEIGAKMVIIAHEKCRSSFTDQALLNDLHQNLLYYTQEELEHGTIVNSVVELLPKLKLAKFMYLRERRRWGDNVRK